VKHSHSLCCSNSRILVWTAIAGYFHSLHVAHEKK
jgi:hypothetical protein